MRAPRLAAALGAALVPFLFVVAESVAQCPEAPPLQHFTGATRVTCPCFATGEQAGVVFTAPAAHYPLEVLRVGIAWGSANGGTGASLEEAIHVYAAGLPDPGTPIFTIEGPVLNDGAINQFNLEPYPGEIVVESGPFTVALEFLNENATNPFMPSVLHDGDGCQEGKNVVYAPSLGGWWDSCVLGVQGDWVFFVVYRPCASTTGVDEHTLTSSATLAPARPNPFRDRTQLEFVLPEAGVTSLQIYDVTGRRIAALADGHFAAGRHQVAWDGVSAEGVPVGPGVYLVELRTAAQRARRSILRVR